MQETDPSATKASLASLSAVRPCRHRVGTPRNQSRTSKFHTTAHAPASTTANPKPRGSRQWRRRASADRAPNLAVSRNADCGETSHLPAQCQRSVRAQIVGIIRQGEDHASPETSANPESGRDKTASPTSRGRGGFGGCGRDSGRQPGAPGVTYSYRTGPTANRCPSRGASAGRSRSPVESARVGVPDDGSDRSTVRR
jgi:hypothetical protein